MPTFVHLPSGNWRAVIRRKRRYVAETFRRKIDAETWALDMERRADLGQDVATSRPASLATFADLIDLHISDVHEVRKPLRRSNKASLAHLRRRLGATPVAKLTRDVLVEYGRARGKEGVAPPTIAIEISFVNTIVTHAAAVHGVVVSKEPVDLARVALRRLGLVGRGNERDRRPTQAELDAIIGNLEANDRQTSPVGRIVRFAVATAMRQAEISSIRWPDIDERRRTVLVRDRKDPRKKDGNHQRGRRPPRPQATHLKPRGAVVRSSEQVNKFDRTNISNSTIKRTSKSASEREGASSTWVSPPSYLTVSQCLISRLHDVASDAPQPVR